MPVSAPQKCWISSISTPTEMLQGKEVHSLLNLNSHYTIAAVHTTFSSLRLDPYPLWHEEDAEFKLVTFLVQVPLPVHLLKWASYARTLVL